MAHFGPTSHARLGTCDARLQDVFNLVVARFDCSILEGTRSIERQRELVAAGTSKTMASKHLFAPSRAVDAAPYPIDWGEEGDPERRFRAKARFYLFAGYVLATAEFLGVRLRWGGDWDGDKDPRDQTWDDLVHFEIVEG